MAEISFLLSHFNAMCDNICVVCVKPAEGYICWPLSRALYAEAITLSSSRQISETHVTLQSNAEILL